MSLKLPLTPTTYDKGDQAQMRGAIERADLQNRKRQEDLVLGPGQRLVFYDEHGAEQHFTGTILGGLVRSDIAAQGLSPAEQANARANIATGSEAAGAAGGASGQVQVNRGGGFGGFTVGGDGTLNTATGALTVTRTAGTPFAASATTDTTNASNIASGTLASARGGAGTVNGLLKANGAGAVSQAVRGTDYAPATSGASILCGDGAGGFSRVAVGSGLAFSGGVLSAAVAPASPTATAGPAAVNGSASTFMRSDAAPAVQLGSASQAGIVQVDGTTITANGGVISAVGGGGRGAWPLNIVQEAVFGSSNNATAFTVTFPSALAASGNTAFMIVACDGAQIVTTPTGWTVDLNVQQAANSRLLLLHKASANDTSATFSTTSGTSYGVFFFEVSGSHALDQSSTGGVTNRSTVVLPSITPSANSVVFGVAAVVPSPSYANYALVTPPSLSPSWKAISANGTGLNSRTLIGNVSTVAALHASITPPVISIPGSWLFSGGGIAYATFSIL